MKKLLTLLVLVITSISMANAQQGSKSALLHVGYQSNYERFGLGIEGRYEFIDNFRIAPEVAVFFPKNHVTGLDINVNVHYTFKEVLDRLTIYPLAGINMNNNHIGKIKIGDNEYEIPGSNYTKMGFNVGAGAEYNLDYGFLSFDIKATFADESYGQFMVGYGLRF